MALQLTTNNKLMTPALTQSIKNNVARKSGNKHVSGDTYKRRTYWRRVADFIGSSRSVSVVAKAHFESKQYCEAAILRKNFQAQQRSDELGRNLTDGEYDDAVWNSNGVQNRTMREDFVRYSQNFYGNDESLSSRNCWARKFSGLAHNLHGLCEMNAAPTGMTHNAIRNTVANKVDEKSTKNKFFMFGLLGFIGVGTTEGLSALRGLSDMGQVLGQSLGALLVAFPAASSAMGGLGTVAGVASQLLIEKQTLTPEQKKNLSKDVSENLQKLLLVLKPIKNNPELIQVTAKAMQGKYHYLSSKISSSNLDSQGVPIILNEALAAIDLGASDFDNMRALKNVVGEYLQVDKPTGNQATLWSRYRYAKAVTTKESHYVALVSLVDHMTVKNPHADKLQDLRRYLEEKKVPKFHNFLLNQLAKPAAVFDFVAGTHTASKLKEWASQEYKDNKAKRLNDPNRAAEHCFNGQYMANNTHQYKRITRTFIKLSEAMRIFNMNIVLASNANLSRIFNNAAKFTHNTLGTSPASRSMCSSIGRFFGGAVLAILVGSVIPVAAEAGDGSVNVDVGGDFPVDFTITNIGILMFLLAAPTLVTQGIAQLVARMEGWEGAIAKKAKPETRTFEFNSRT